EFFQKYDLLLSFHRRRFFGSGVRDGFFCASACVYKIAGYHGAGPSNTSFAEYGNRKISQSARINIPNKLGYLSEGGGLAILNGQALELKTSFFKYRMIAGDVEQARHRAYSCVIKGGQIIWVGSQITAKVVSARWVNVRHGHSVQNAINGPPHDFG